MSDIDELMIQDLMDMNEVDRSVAVNAYNKILSKKPIKTYKKVDAIVDDIIEENNKKLALQKEADEEKADAEFTNLVAECKARNKLQNDKGSTITATSSKEDIIKGIDNPDDIIKDLI